MCDDSQLSLEECLIFERYKHLNARQAHLDSLISGNFVTTIKVTTALCTFFFVSMSFIFKETDVNDSNLVTLMLQFCAITGGVFYLLMSLQTFANILAWFGYRNDEVKLLDLADTKLRRESPKAGNFLTWQETWFLVGTVVLTLSSYVLWVRAAEIAVKLIS